MNKSIISMVLMVSSLCPTPLFAQSVYPGQHKGKIKVEAHIPFKAECFDLKNVSLLPGRVHDNLMRDSAWMASIPVNCLLHSFRNNAGVFAGLEGGYESVRKLTGTAI
ncbi:MAG: glycoside hydrolase family 127 protein [Muribaculaceae bacterium]|nr:glycoside hydrolase family 127 protein [Muribaculaceae bacterium]